MNPSLAWVVGQGGFLGSRVQRELRGILPEVHAWTPEGPRFAWEDPSCLGGQLDESARAFADAVRSGGGPWMVLWCAGAGGVAAPADALASETRALEGLLEGLSRHLAGPCPDGRGIFLLSSSAGGVYGESVDLPLTEDSPCRPLSDYGRNKLRQEGGVQAWTERHPQVSLLIARISNLYGPGQNLSKPVGLISQLSRSLIYNHPTHVYVPLDTTRDYLHVGDGARHIVRCLARLLASDRPRSVTKLFASEQGVSIAGILGLLHRIAKHRPRVICAAHPHRKQQPGRLAFRSKVWTDTSAAPATDLAAGIFSVYQHHLALFQQGRLPAPLRA